MNYLYLSRKHAGGKDQVGLNLIKGFEENGVASSMLVVCYDYSVKTIKELSPSCHIYPVKSRKTSSELLRLLDLEIKNTFLIPRIVKEYRIQLLFHLSYMNGFRKAPCTIVTIPHDIKAVSHRVLGNVKIPYIKYIIYKIIYYVDFYHSDYIISISDTDKGEISSYFPKFSHKIKRIYNPIRLRDIENKNNINKNQLVAINLQFHHKNIITLLRAFNLIKDDIPHNLLLIGGVPNRVSYLKDYVIEHGLENRIVFSGFLSDEEMTQELISSNLYINPTLYEGFGMTAVEAIIRKVPTLVSGIKTNIEVTNRHSRYYSPPESVFELANSIKSSLKEPPSKAQLDFWSRDLYNRYNYHQISREYYEFFKKSIQSSHYPPEL